jgi:hypothetical protein
MLFFPITLVAGIVLYTGSKAFVLAKVSERIDRHKKKVVSAKTKKADQTLAIASMSLSLAATGIVLRIPLLGAASIPIILYIFTPTFKNAWQKLYAKRRINDQVLTATRVTVCVVMGYNLIAALDAVLLAVSDRHCIRQQEKFHRSLQEACTNTLQLANKYSTDLQQTLLAASAIQQHGERHGEQMAPWMLAAFVVTLPMIGVNRAAAFLTTTFGAHLRKLGPYTSQQLSLQALEQGILITQASSLEQAMQVDTLVFSEQLFHDAITRSQAMNVMHDLRQRYVQDNAQGSQALSLQIVLTDKAILQLEWLADLGMDGYIRTSPDQPLADALLQLQAEGRTVCYVDIDTRHDAARPTLSLTFAAHPLMNGEMASPDIILFGNGLQPLPQVFDLAASFKAKQHFNLIAPTGVDLIDISTTLLLDFGLIYSVLFTYSGLLLGMANSHGLKQGYQDQNTAAAITPTVASNCESGV